MRPGSALAGARSQSKGRGDSGGDVGTLVVAIRGGLVRLRFILNYAYGGQSIGPY